MLTPTPQRFSADVERMLRNAGWFPGRNVTRSLKLPEMFHPVPIALQILGEFGYLHVGHSKPGLERPQRTIHFDPMHAWGEDDRFAEYGDLMQRRLYPLGDVNGGYFFLAIDETGSVFQLMDQCWFVAAQFDAALEKLLLGSAVHLVDDQGHWSAT